MSLLSAFRRALPKSAPPFDESATERRLETMVAQARAAWPKVAVEPERYAAHLGRHVATQAPLAALESMFAVDLWLAYACGHGDALALDALDRTVLAEVKRTLSQFDESDTVGSDAAQVLSQRLLVGTGGGEPKILSYSGRGPLAGWACAAAIRTALTLRKREAREVAADEVEQLEQAVEGPELQALRDLHLGDFKGAFETAFRALTSQERNVLRLHVLDGLNIDDIGVIYRVHRATVARWIASARAQLREQTQHTLGTQLTLSPSRVDSLVESLDAELDLSLERLLRAPSQGGD